MANVTFSGPIRAGTIRDTTGTTPGINMANVGQAVMSQSYRFTQANLQTSSLTPIVVPANSQIIEIMLFIDAALSGATTTLTAGTSALATAYTASGAIIGSAVGVVSVVPGTDPTRTQAFIDVGTTDVRIALAVANTGTGTGVITVRYAQNLNLL